MRRWGVWVLLVACKGGSAGEQGGSGSSPAGPAAQPAVVARSAAAEAGVAVIADAGLDAALPDAASAFAFSTSISNDGIGPVTAGFQLPSRDASDEADTATLRFARLVPGLEVDHRDHLSDSFEVTELFASHRDKTVLRVVLDHYRDPPLAYAVALDPIFALPSGIGVGSTVGELAGQFPDLTCTYETYDATQDIFGVTQGLPCKTSQLPRLQFEVDLAKWRSKPGPVPVAKLATRKLVKISWFNEQP